MNGENPAFTKSFDFKVENTELLEELTVVDAEVHTNENMDDIAQHIENKELREEEIQGYITETSRNGALGGIEYNFYNPKCGGEKGGRPFLKKPLKTVDDIREQQNDIMADKVLINTIHSLRLGKIAVTKKKAPYLKAMNRFIIENLATDGQNYFTGVAVNPDLPEESAKEIEKYADNNAIKYVFTPASHEKPLGNSRYEPILEACEKHDLPYLMHGTATTDRNNYLDYDKYFEQRAMGQVMPHLRNVVSLIGEEVPERFDTQFMFMEHGFGWAPFMMGRLDRELEIRGFEVPGLDLKPSEYMQDFYYGTQPMIKPPNESYVGQMLEMNGLNDQVVYMSDYPHPDADHPGTIADHKGLSRSQKVKILQDNAHRLFDI
jgi:predicted TIM-barrel fold metal-dependent hydrolase